jgi:hypothetical protein
VHATTLLLAGVPVHVVANRLGHADPRLRCGSTHTSYASTPADIGDVFAAAVSLVLAQVSADRCIDLLRIVKPGSEVWVVVELRGFEPLTFSLRRHVWL